MAEVSEELLYLLSGEHHIWFPVNEQDFIEELKRNSQRNGTKTGQMRDLKSDKNNGKILTWFKSAQEFVTRHEIYAVNMNM
jgi:hypothetical protein